MTDEHSSSPADDHRQLRHDLRTPLNHIIGYSEMLVEEAARSGLTTFVADLQKIHEAAYTLLATIDRALGVSFSPRGRRAPASADWASRTLTGRVLVVDDDEANGDVLAHRLERCGCTVARAGSGSEALDRLAAESFDLLLLDVMMPDVNGDVVLERLKSHPETRHVPVVMISANDEIDLIARCLELGADDYLPKPCEPALLVARAASSLERKALRDEEQRAHQALVASQKELAVQLADAADYVESLLPSPIATGPVAAEWRFIPSASLGGDAFGYHWLDEDHFAMYLLDVSGHGVGAALLSAAAINALRSHGLGSTDFRNPSEVLARLNDAFQMEAQNNLYFTAWYGVYRPSTRHLVFASAGHPPAVLVHPGQVVPLEISLLASEGPVVGMLPDTVYPSDRCVVPPGSRLFVFSDGVYEIDREDGTLWTIAELARYLAEPSSQHDIDRVVTRARTLQGRPDFPDDFSMVRFEFQ